MRSFIFLLGFYVLALSIMPCNDIGENHNDYYLSQNEQPNNQNDNSESFYYCSPLCICSCCGIYVFVNSILPDESKSKIIFFDNTLSSFTDQTFKSGYFGSIWQPPKIS